MGPRNKSTFVLDTNVVLHDHQCLEHFQEHDVVIPITVLEELDRFKKGGDSMNYSAREFIRTLDALAVNGLPPEGLSLGENRGRLFIHSKAPDMSMMDGFFTHDTPDHRILAVAAEYDRALPDSDVVLISKDINLRMKAVAMGISAEDYETDKAPWPDELYTGTAILENSSPELISRFYDQPFSVPAEEVPGLVAPMPNQFYILKNGSVSALAYLDSTMQFLQRVQKRRAYGIDPRNAGQAFAMHALLDPDIPLVTLTGKAGTGKTLLALAAALETRKRYRQIYLARPVVPLSNRDMGFLPGDIASKLDPYMQPLWDNLGVIKGSFAADSMEADRIEDMIESDRLRITPLAYIRGRSLNRAYFIVDEAQNLTPHEVKTIITRAGEGTKFVFTGDIQQIDTPYLDSRSNGLAYLVERMKGEKLYAHVNLVKGERSVLAELASNLL
ncbi:MAG: PhoH family protein [Candidatus Fermentibacteraceae bacterium]